jgi:hypothetical protein
MTTPEDYIKQIAIYKEQYPAILDDFKAAYINYNMNPASDEYLRIYNTANSAINTINSQLFTTTNNIQQSITNLNRTIPNIGGKIDKQKLLHSNLANKYANINGSTHGAYRLTDEVKDIYKTQYSINVTLFVGILISLFLLFRIFKKEGGIGVPSMKSSNSYKKSSSSSSSSSSAQPYSSSSSQSSRSTRN